MRARVALVSLAQPGTGWGSSGAEVIATSVCEGLAASLELTTVFGYSEKEPPPGEASLKARDYRALPGFPLSQKVIESGVLTAAQLTAGARQAVEDADVVLQFERVLEPFFRGSSVVSLGSVAYEHCRAIVASDHWDILIVPSLFVRSNIREWSSRMREIRVVENGIDLSHFRPLSANRVRDLNEPLRFLLAGRPEWGKGYLSALRLVESLAELGVRSGIDCFRYRGFLEVGDFYARLEACFPEESLSVHDWQPRDSMPSWYRRSTATLCLGDTPEGFGLTAVESLACGVPVIYKPLGHLGDIVPAGCGMCSLPEFERQLARGAHPRELLDELRRDCLDEGVGAVRRRFSSETMVEGYLQVLASVH